MENRSFFVQSEGRYIPTDGQAQSFLTLNFTQKNSLGVGTGTVIPTANPDNPSAIANIQVQDLWGSVGAGANAPIYRLTNVGIGTANPQAALQVSNTFTVTSSGIVSATKYYGDGSSLANISNAPGLFDTSVVRSTAANPQFIGFSSVSSGINTTLFVNTNLTYIPSSNRLGIGIANPSQTLHVQGDVRITGSIYDSQNSSGTSGQVLKSTITGTRWTTVNADGTPEPFRISNNDSDITVSTGNTITVTTNTVGIVTFTQSAVTLATTGIVQQLFENINLSSTQLTGTINLDILTGSLFYYTANATGNWTFNIRGNSSTTLNSILPIGKSATVTILSTQGGSATYANAFNIDGAAVSPKWVGGTAPSSGYANSINTYTLSILKTADATYTVIASLSKFS
jgi:hypothetical protein